MRAAAKTDGKLLWIVGSVMVLLIVGVSVFAPAQTQDDPLPTTTNTGPLGARAAYETLQGLDYNVSRWDRPLDELTRLDATKTTLVLAQPVYEATERDLLATSVKAFLERGGRVLATDASGALLLPGGKVAARGVLQQALCQSTPEGPGKLARGGSVELAEHAQWDSEDPKFSVAQRCGNDAVVVSYAVSGPEGKAGTAIWWSSATPLDNAELKRDGDLRLLLASLQSSPQDGRAVVFDEGLHGHADSLWQYAHRLGLPLRWVELQATVLGLLLVLSFSRRRGPVRVPLLRPRTSPVEFAESMGDLYARARAISAATDAARRRLLQVLERDAGLSRLTIAAGPAAIAEALQERLGGDWRVLRDHLLATVDAQHGELSSSSALALVRAMNDDAENVQERARPATVTTVLKENV